MSAPTFEPPTPNLPLLRKKRIVGMTERFWEQVEVAPNGCAIFTGCTDLGGYGLFRHYGKQGLVHRAIYTELVGPIPEGMTLDHLCRQAACIAVDHLEITPLRENILRAKRVIIHCRQGHPFSAENTRLVKGGTARRCKACELQSNRRYRAKEKAS